MKKLILDTVREGYGTDQAKRTMSYSEIKKLTEGMEFPITAKNEDGENVIIEIGYVDGEMLFTLTTAQSNGWMRINTYWSDGTIEETYKK